MRITRRQFAGASLAAASAVSMPRVARARVLGANDEILVGVVGCGGRGRGAHVPSFQKQEGVND